MDMIGLKGEALERLCFELFCKIFLGNAQGDVRQIVLPAGLRNKCLDPADGLGVDPGADESLSGPATYRKWSSRRQSPSDAVASAQEYARQRRLYRDSSPNYILISLCLQPQFRRTFGGENFRERGGHRVEVFGSHETLQQRDMRRMRRVQLISTGRFSRKRALTAWAFPIIV